MKLTKNCPECGGTEIYKQWADASGSEPYIFNLLPLVGKFLSIASFEVFVCGDCGFYRMFVEEDWMPQIREKWSRHE